jgi:hypothetical protein
MNRKSDPAHGFKVLTSIRRRQNFVYFLTARVKGALHHYEDKK